jgi:hypothetical protein
VGFSVRSLVYEEHFSWYSWAIAALTGTVYTFGFVLMTPQVSSPFIGARARSR